jgi:hypothetical protein
MHFWFNSWPNFPPRNLKSVMEWLTEDDQPAVKYLTMRDLLDASKGDLRQAWTEIPNRGWVAQILQKRLPGGFWVDGENLYRPKYTSTNWMLLILSDLGVTRELPWLAESAEMWRDRYARSDGGFDNPGAEKSELCLVGNTARALVKFGYVDDPKVVSAYGWLVRNQKPNGGWHCWGKNGVIDGWEGMSALAVYPRQKWTRGMKRAVDRGLEFYLERRLLHQGDRYDPWYRLHFPYHYYYDLLVGLEFVTALGGGGDPRAATAIRLLKAKKRKDGRWLMDAVHPDYLSAGKLPRWWSKYSKLRVPFSLEAAGQPSKMITFRALRVLRQLGDSMPP